MKKIAIISCMMLSSWMSMAQDDLLDLVADEKPAPSFVTGTFKSNRVVSSHSIEMVKKHGLEFRVTHRFGDIGGTAGGFHTLYGLDNSSNIRIAFEYGVSDRFNIGFGRNKMSEALDGYLKYQLLRQTTDNSMPVSLILLTSSTVTPQKNTADKAYSNGLHRLTYVHGITVGRKFSSWLSLQATGGVSHRNYVFSTDDVNTTPYFGFAGRLKLTKRFSVLADWINVISDYRTKFASTIYNPLGMGIEIETGGHIFQLFFTNSGGIVENQYIANTTSNWGKGQVKFGFNISRTFTVKKTKKVATEE